MNDQNIRDFFHTNRPVTSDEGTYLASLKPRLDAMEEVKRLHDIESARCRRKTIAAFVCGMALGAALLAVVLLRPVSAPHLNAALLTSVSSFIAEWRTFFISGIAISALVLGLIPWGKGNKRLL